MRICVGLVCGVCNKDITRKTMKVGLDGHGVCAKCYKAHGQELFYYEEAFVIGDNRDFEEIARAAGADLVDGTMGDIGDYDPDREQVLMFVGAERDLEWLTVKLEGKTINKKNLAKARKSYTFGKLSLKDAKRFSQAA